MIERALHTSAAFDQNALILDALVVLLLAYMLIDHGLVLTGMLHYAGIALS